MSASGQHYTLPEPAEGGQDFGQQLARAVAKLRSGDTLTIPEGTYHIYPDDLPERFLAPSNNQRSLKRVAILLENLQDIFIIGEGSRLVFHGQIVPLHIHACSRIHFSGVSIDWHRPFYSQAVIRDYDDQEIEFQIDTQRYPCEIADGAMRFIGEGWTAPFSEGVFEIDHQTGAPAYLSGDNFGVRGRDFNFEQMPARQTESDRFRIRLPHKHEPTLGNLLLLRHYPRLSPGVFLSKSKDICLKSVDIHHAGAMGVIAQYCENIQLDRVTVAPPTDSDRVFSVTVDATHFMNCRGMVHLKDCYFSHMMDDPCNVHGLNSRFAGRIDKYTALFETVHHEQHGVPVAFPGDRVQLASNITLLPYAELTVRSAQRMDHRLIAVKFTEPLPDQLGDGHVMENLTWTADLHVEGCRSGPNRARGYLISTPGKVLLENNHITAAGAGVKISGDANYWFESGAVRDVTIRNNTFIDCCYGPLAWGSAVIDIDPEIEHPEAAPSAFHRNIRIEANTFRTFDPSILYARSVDGLSFTHNQVDLTDTHPEIGRHKAILNFEACQNVDVSDNAIDPSISRPLR